MRGGTPNLAGRPAAAADVSVIIPVFNRPDAVLRAAGSALCQDPAPREVIVVDDGSTDRTADRLAAEYGSRIRICSNSGPKGANGARNTGAALASGRWLAFLDSDDRYLPGKLARQIAAMVAEGAGFSCTGFVTGTGRSHRLPAYSKRRLLTRNCLGGTSGLVVSRGLFLRECFDPAMPAVQDWELYLRLVRHGPPAVVRDPLYTYTQTGNRITANRRKRLLGHRRLFRTRIRPDPDSTPGILLYHRLVQKALHRPDGGGLLLRAALKLGACLA